MSYKPFDLRTPHPSRGLKIWMLDGIELSRAVSILPSHPTPDATEVIAGLKKPLHKIPLIAVALIAAVGLVPAFRQRVIEQFRAPPNVRLAVLPVEGSKDTVLIGGVLQDASDRVSRFRSERTVAVISPRSR